MRPDLRGILRRRKPERRRAQLRARSGGALVTVADLGDQGRPVLVPDTGIYILDAAGRLPEAAVALLDRALLFHCAVCLAELAVGVDNADPAHPGWPKLRDHYAALFDAVPDTRVLTPDAEVWAEAGIVSGTLARTQGYGCQQRKEGLNDALIYLTAARAGLPVLTANRDEFDLVQRLAPEGLVVHL